MNASPYQLPPFFARIEKLPLSTKLVLVVAGFVVAALVTVMAVGLYSQLYPQRMADPSGMAAFGDALLLVFLFAISAALPTLLTLAFLTRTAGFWAVWSVLSLSAAALVLAAAANMILPRWLPAWQGVPLLGTRAVPAVLAAPLLLALFAASAWLAPGRRARRAAQLSAVLAGLAMLIGFSHWLAR